MNFLKGDIFMPNIKEQNNILCLSPLKKYTPPKYPTSAESRSNPVLLKKLPSRWQKSAKVLACIGLVGTIALSGCTSESSTEPPSGGNNYYDWNMHGGGGPPLPYYVVYLTEQEALAIIRAETEMAGLRLDTVPPDDIVNIGRDLMNIEFHLFDESKDIAITYIEDIWWSIQNRNSFAQFIEEEFAIQNIDITVGVFYSEFVELWQRPEVEEKEEARRTLEEHLTAQVRDFLELLREQGIIE